MGTLCIDGRYRGCRRNASIDVYRITCMHIYILLAFAAFYLLSISKQTIILVPIDLATLA